MGLKILLIAGNIIVDAFFTTVRHWLEFRYVYDFRALEIKIHLKF